MENVVKMLVMVVLVLLPLSGSWAAHTEVAATADTWVLVDSNTNYNGTSYVAVAGGKNGLVKMDLTGQIPSGQVITNATLDIWVNYLGGNTWVNIYVETDAWVETTATGNTTDGVTPWGGAGAGFGTGMVSGSNVLVTQLVNSTGWSSFDVTSAVQAWYSGSAANNGLLLERIPFGAGFQFQNRLGGYFPKLSITYEPRWQETVDGNNIQYRYGKPHFPAEITSFQNPDANTAWSGTVISPANYVPTGLYVGDYGDALWDYSFTKMAELYGNSSYIGGSSDPSFFPSNPSTLTCASRDGQIEIATRAARLGSRIYYQNSSSEYYWPSRITMQPNNPPIRSGKYNDANEWATAMLPDFVNDVELRQGILAWGLCEEIDANTAMGEDPCLPWCRNNIFKRLDPNHPALIMLMGVHHTLQEYLYDSWGEDIQIMVTDPYYNNRGNLRTPVSTQYLTMLGNWQTVARSHGNDKLWIILPCFSENDNAFSDPNGQGWYMITPEDMDMACWTGLAHGATGFYLFREYGDEINGRTALTKFEWKQTEEYMAASRFFRTIRRLAPVISEWYADTSTVYDANYGFVIGSLHHPGYGDFKVIANVYRTTDVNYAVPSEPNYYELNNFTAVQGSTITLPPGKGVVLFKGTTAKLNDLRMSLGATAEINTEPPLTAYKETWLTNTSNEEIVQSRTAAPFCPVTFGGKGGMPWVYTETQMTVLPDWGGELLTWRADVKIPAGIYFPPRPGVNEKMLFLKWDLSSLDPLTVNVESAVFELTTHPDGLGITNGRLAIYPVVGDSNELLYDAMEFMPRWEKDFFTVDANSKVRFEIGGMVQEWISGDMDNRGLLVVYSGWPDNTNSVTLSSIGPLNIKYYSAQSSSPVPANAATGVRVVPSMSWTTGNGSTSHDIYLGTSYNSVANATRSSSEYKGVSGNNMYEPAPLNGNTTYYWRIDEITHTGTVKGIVWSFTTGPIFVAAGSVASGTGTITPALPSGIAANDILLLFLETANQAITITNQNGGTWTQVANSPQGTGTGGSTTATGLTVFWSRYNGTQGAPTTSDSGDHQFGRIIAIRGAVASGNPWDVTAGGIEAASDTSGSIPGATTTVVNTLVVTVIAAALPDADGTANFSNWTNGNLISVTERIDNTVTTGNGGGLGIATGIKATAGAYGNTAVTLGSSAYKGMMSIAIKP